MPLFKKNEFNYSGKIIFDGKEVKNLQVKIPNFRNFFIFYIGNCLGF